MRRRAQFLVSAALLTFFAACGGGGDDGGGPTAPPPTPQVAGAWVGEWSTGGLVFQPTLNLTQTGSTLNGTFMLFGSTITITGSVNTSLQMALNSVGGGCETLAGNGVIDAVVATRITGNLEFDMRTCANPALFVGPVIWRRAGG